MKADKRSLALILALVLICTVLPGPGGHRLRMCSLCSRLRWRGRLPPFRRRAMVMSGRCSVSRAAAISPRTATILRSYYADLAAKVPELTAASGRDGALNAYKSTDNSRVILALSAIGATRRRSAGAI